MQVVWGERDPALPISDQGEYARRTAGLSEIHTVPGKHFIPEDHPVAIAERVAELARWS